MILAFSNYHVYLLLHSNPEQLARHSCIDLCICFRQSAHRKRATPPHCIFCKTERHAERVKILFLYKLEKMKTIVLLYEWYLSNNLKCLGLIF